MTGNRWFLRLGELHDGSIAGLITSGFELMNCSYSFYQMVDDRGKSQTNVRIAGLDLVYDGLPSNEVIDWGVSSRRYYSGVLVLVDANDMPQEKIFFEDGACIQFRISYISDGNSYVSTTLRISPRVVKIDGDVLSQPWTLDEVSTYLKRSCNTIEKMIQPIGKTDAYLEINGENYELSAFDLTCEQPTDFKGQPVSDIRGGSVGFTIPQMPDATLRKWMIHSDQLMDGEFQFRRGDQSMPLRICFQQAYCIQMTPCKGSKGEMMTSFVIRANELILNEKSLFNDWRL